MVPPRGVSQAHGGSSTFLAVTNADQFDYSWVNAASEVGVATCFSFFDGPTVEDVVSRAGIREWRTEDFRGPASASSPLDDSEVAVFSESGWTVAYEPNGYPERLANKIAAEGDVARCVIVFWNVNAVTEFAYWERGTQVVAFDWPQYRRGSDPDRLLADMQVTVGLERTGLEDGSVFDIYQQMLALGERVTGVHLGPDFLQRPSVVVGYINENDEEDGSDDYGDAAGSALSPPRQRRWVEPGTRGRAEWVPEERRMNEQALEGIPKDRWEEIPARLARLACERVRIADRFPLDEILGDLDQGRRPSPARMTVPMDVYAQVEGVTFGLGAPSTERVWAAIETVFEAAKARSRRAPLGVLLQARVTADDHTTAVIDEMRAEMGLTD